MLCFFKGARGRLTNGCAPVHSPLSPLISFSLITSSYQYGPNNINLIVCRYIKNVYLIYISILNKYLFNFYVCVKL